MWRVYADYSNPKAQLDLLDQVIESRYTTKPVAVYSCPPSNCRLRVGKWTCLLFDRLQLGHVALMIYSTIDAQAIVIRCRLAKIWPEESI